MSDHADNSFPTRWSLVARLKDWDDSESWREFFDTYRNLIYAAAVKAGLGDAEAQEVVQETFICVARKIGDFKLVPALGSFKAWLLRIARWRISDQIRKQNNRRCDPAASASDVESEVALDRVPDPAGLKLESLWDEEWEKNLIDAALERVKSLVKPKQFQIYYLHVIRNSPAEKVARTLGVSAAHVYLAKHRVGRLVRKAIERLRVNLT